MEKFLCPSDRSGPISQKGLATFVRSPNDPQFISCTILAFAFFWLFFYIHFALACHISGDGIAATKSTIFPLAPSWLLHFSLFCVLKYFFALLCHISEDGLAAKIPNDLQFISLSKFFIAKPILFSSNCFFLKL